MNRYHILLTLTLITIVTLFGIDISLESKRQNKIINNNLVNQKSQVQTLQINKNITINKIPVLMYHSISNGNNSLYVSMNKFQQQISFFINSNYNFITFEDLENNNIPDNPMILTFDDGYEDFYTNAYPILEKNNIKATVFIIVDK